MIRLVRWIPIAVALLVYAPSLGFDRTFDDLYHVPPPGEPPRHDLVTVWESRYWGEDQGGGLYRPFTSTTYWIEGKLHLPLSVRHGVNMLLHGTVTWLVVEAAIVLGLPVWAASVAGILFAVHPTHVETVAGLVGRAELLAAIFMLLALALHVRFLRHRARAGFVLAGTLVLAFLAACSKESAWFLPLFALPLHVVWKAPLRRGWPAWLGYALGIGIHLVLRRQILGGWMNAPDVVIDVSDNPLVALHGVERLLGGLRVLGENVGHLILPLVLAPDYSGTHIAVTGSVADRRILLALVFLTGSLVLAWHGWRRRAQGTAATWLISGTWLLVSALFFMNLFLDLGTVLADRLLFWPSIAWSLLVGAVLAAGIERGARVPTILAEAIAAGLFLVYAGQTVGYVPQWRDDVTLFTPATRTVPESARVWYNFGRAVQDEGRLDEALAAFQRARTLAPSDYQSWAQEATVLLQQGAWERAQAPLAEALRIYPRDAVSLVNEGVVWLQQGEVERAATRFRDMWDRHPERTEALLNLALAEGRLGHVDTALTLWRRYIEMKPQDPEGLNNLAWLLATQGDRAADAEPFARKAVALRPGDANLRDTLAETLLRQGKRDAAAEVAKDALLLDPDSALAFSLRRFLGPETTATDSSASSKR